ncbi:uncharacterized protein EKO05_0011382 [Ascochyta rabiei]|uniref:Uncharacterized protein n=1 Tax=Didymella rabiei TaxID=5454 RepID=A0A163KBJ9_DIDRA|nr:uncharacterized protein EKO05_0011382 [Ascochyta rabiei]KZM26898.1 hypothetical protein ST47_g1992 [Ascochyta rabiei]UPX21187.1 hypothetical protein EKO05_0011382 [Ascochyta rabiei]
MEDQADDASKTDAYTTAKPSKFHFKSSSSRRKTRHDRETSSQDKEERSSKRQRSEDDDGARRSRHDSRRKHKHRHREDRHPTSTFDGDYYDPDHRYRESLFDHVDTNENEVFRESLFDALADDEGAAYWEGVYGQPINIYPTEKPGSDGKLERMTEDEYADFVRTKMWEKSHQHIVEEREAREKARQERKKQRSKYDEEAGRGEKEREGIRRQMEESLRRGEERKRAKQAAAAWETYNTKWDYLSRAENTAETEDTKIRELIPWPVLSGNSKHVDKEEIERFLRASLAWKEDSSALLKTERVRWHPDKMQRRFGQHIDEETIRTVTAVFQIIDQMWNALR